MAENVPPEIVIKKEQFDDEPLRGQQNAVVKREPLGDGPWPLAKTGPCLRAVKREPDECGANAVVEAEKSKLTQINAVAAAIVKRVLESCSTISKTKEFMAMIRNRAQRSANGGAKLRICKQNVTEQDVAEATRQVRASWFARKARVYAMRPKVGVLSNTDYIFGKMILRCGDAKTAQKFLAMLTRGIGQTNKSGRVFVNEDIDRARGLLEKWWQTCEAAWPEKTKHVGSPGHSSSSSSNSSSDESDDSSDSSGSSSSGSSENSQKSRSKAWKKHQRRLEEDAEDVFFESDDSDLSEEEEVDVDEFRQPILPVGLDVQTPTQDVKETSAPVDDYPADWSGAPSVGSRGFNDFAVALMRKFGVASAPLRATLKGVERCPPLQPHQEAAVFLLHPKSPIYRLLVDHPTGSGKTREMIQMLNNYFFDSRPKVPIFPKEHVCKNFYAELLRWPNRYRDFFCCLKAHLVVPLAGGKDWRRARDRLWNVGGLSDEIMRELVKEMRDTLEMKGWFFMGQMRKGLGQNFRQRFPGEHLPAAPLRALRYTSAGGQHTTLRNDGLPKSALFKIGFSFSDSNVYSNKIVVMDEVHNLVRTQTQYGQQLERLRELLCAANRIVLAGFTGTPILSEPSEGRMLLNIIKGADGSRNDEGFVSSFPMRPTPLFPRSLPVGIPDAVLTPKLRRRFVRKVALFGEPLQKYDEKRAKGIPERRLRAYCNMCVHFGSFHDGKNGSKKRIMNNFEISAPKLDVLANDIVSCPTKTLVLIDRRTGMTALLERLFQIGAKLNFGVATMDDLLAFNSSKTNLRGEVYRVLVADASTCSEGVSFFGVRRVFLADVPATPSVLVQSVGRAIRMYSHSGLSEEEQTVSTYIYVATFPRWLRSPLGAWAYRAQKRHQDPQETASKARRLLRTLKKVGVADFDDLKQRLDVYGAKFDGNQASQGSNKSAFLKSSALGGRQRVAPTAQTQKEPKEMPKVKQEEDLNMSLAALAKGASAALPKIKAGSTRKNETKLMKEAVAKPETGLEGENAELEKNPISPSTCVTFLESLGLWEEAKLIKNCEQSKRGPGVSNKRPAKKPAKKPTVGNVKPSDPEKYVRRHHLVRALRALYGTSSATVAVDSLHLQPRTADEVALQVLADKSKEFVPALEELRSKAVDRAILTDMVARQSKDVKAEISSAGESSACEFGLSSASSGDDGKKREAPLVLPPGWRVDTVSQGNRKVRVFVDPSGVQYRTEAKAKIAVAAVRRAGNMARMLKKKYSAKFAQQDVMMTPPKTVFGRENQLKHNLSVTPGRAGIEPLGKIPSLPLRREGAANPIACPRDEADQPMLQSPPPKVKVEAQSPAKHSNNPISMESGVCVIDTPLPPRGNATTGLAFGTNFLENCLVKDGSGSESTDLAFPMISKTADTKTPELAQADKTLEADNLLPERKPETDSAQAKRNVSLTLPFAKRRRCW